jgi:hypothetical protein
VILYGSITDGEPGRSQRLGGFLGSPRDVVVREKPLHHPIDHGLEAGR